MKVCSSTGEAGLAWGPWECWQGWEFPSPGITRHFGVLAQPLAAHGLVSAGAFGASGSRALPGVLGLLCGLCTGSGGHFQCCHERISSVVIPWIE